jgi:hypothetical protein
MEDVSDMNQIEDIGRMPREVFSSTFSAALKMWNPDKRNQLETVSEPSEVDRTYSTGWQHYPLVLSVLISQLRNVLSNPGKCKRHVQRFSFRGEIQEITAQRSSWTENTEAVRFT